MDEYFSRQTRRFSAAILTDCKGKRRSMAGKRLARQRSTVVNTGSKDDVEEIINLQPAGNKAKPYQVKQVRNIILKYQLGGAIHEV